MSFNRKNILLNLFLTITLFTSCGLNIGEKNPAPAVAQVKGAQCLNQAISDMKVFFDAEATDDQITGSLICIQDVFVAFKENIRGENKNSYTAREIATFIEINFLEDSDARFSDEFLLQLMKFKKALWGGDETFILKSEIDLAVDFIARMKPEIVRLNPHMKILTSKWSAKLSALEDSAKERQFLAAKNQFKLFIRKISFEFANGNRAYKIDDFFNFIVEVLKFTKSKPDNLDTVQKAKPFFKKFKSFLIGGNESLKGDEWEKLGLTLHEAFFQSLRFKYFIKNLDPSQVEAKWSIYEKVATDLTSLIENLLKTKETQSLTNEEIFELLQPLSEILPEVGLTEDLLNELGDVKVMILGDSPIGRRGWSLSDFKLLKSKIPILFRNLATLVDTIDILKLDNQKYSRTLLSYAEFQASEVKILASINNLSLIIENSYDLNSLKSLLINLSTGPFKKQLKLPENFENLFSSFVSAKYLLTGEPGSLASKTQLRMLMNVGIRGYLNYSEYNIFADPFEFESLDFTLALQRLWPKIKTTLNTELALKPENYIKSSEFTQFIIVLQEQKILKTKLRTESLNLLFEALWTNILNNPKDRLNSISRKGFDTVTLSQMSSFLENWLNLQITISEIFGKSKEWSKFELLSELNQRILNEKNELQKTSLIEQKSFIDQPIAMTFDTSGFLRILEEPSGLYHQSDLSKSNISRIISRLVIQSYAKDEERVLLLNGVKKEEAQFAFDQFKPLAVDFELIDQSNNSFINSRFLEANIFLSVSDGDSLASFSELHHLIIHIFSGISRADDIKDDLLRKCSPPFSGSLNETAPFILEDCALNQYLTNERSFAGLPQFLNMRSVDFNFSQDQLKEYYLNLLKAAGHVPNANKLVLMSDAALFPHVVQYIEMVYARHDINKDNFLQKDEALIAFPLFKELLKDLVKSYKQIKEDDLPGVFVYILKYGRPPRKESIGEVLKFVAFIKDKDQKDWNINSSRLDLGKIFNYIVESTKPTQVPVVTPPVMAQP